MGRARKSERSARSEELEDKEPEPYQPTGNFQTDFAELCKEMEIIRPPAVVPRPKRPMSPEKMEHAQQPTGKKGKEDKKAMQQQQQSTEPEEETPEEKALMELLGFKPKTFTVKSHLELMRPCVQVEMDNPDKQDSVNEVFIKDWKLQAPMLLTLGRCFEKMQKLHSINLWRVAADSKIVCSLAELLKHLPHVKSLALESNSPVSDDSYAELVRVESNLTKLRLRFNQIDDKSAALLAEQLDGLRETPSKLVSLDLSSNCIQDDGAVALAKALRTNRTLIHLSLSNNRLSDRSATALAQVCSRFYLTHDETVQRRRLMSVDARAGASPDRESRQSRPDSSHATPPPSRKGADRPASVRSLEKDRDKKSTAAAKGGKGKKDEKSKPDEKSKGKAAQRDDGKGRGKASAADKDAKTGATKAGKGRGNRVKVTTPQPEQPEQPEVQYDSEHPLLERADTSYAPGYLLVPGNYVLALLNLSRNQITDKGIDEWKTAIKYQAAYMSKQKVLGTGMLKLILQGNPFSQEAESYRALEDELNARDPLRPTVADTS